ncbi:MAG: TetR/AcrR family transcriptional regulator [Bifidobacterium psychraerophilum]|uniref:TetR/AcrR family transcriptional regulator n=1 Tax=Bifidobacterium psychraerophilum TaxID=218140 RepID=UPI0039ECAAD6
MARDARASIIHAAWDLFRAKGFEKTTVDEIIENAGTAKGTFYRHFQGKSALLGTLSDLFDDKYHELERQLDPDSSVVEQIGWLNVEFFDYIERSVPVELLSALLASQLNPRGDRSLVNQERYYFAIHRKLVARGQEHGEITTDISVHDIVRLYAIEERSMLYDWCLHQGAQPLVGEPTRIVAETLERFVIKS